MGKGGGGPVGWERAGARSPPGWGRGGWNRPPPPAPPAIIEGNNFPGTDLCQLAPLWPEKTGLWPYYKRILNLK